MSGTKEEDVVDSPDVHFEPLVKLPPVEIKTMEESEKELFKIRAKLFRFDSSADPPEWKERGTGEVKFLQHKTTHNVRLLMRRDKTHKVCANHFLTSDMKLVASAGSDRAWVYTVQADFADEEAKTEQLAIRFRNAEFAQKFKTEFEKHQSKSADSSVDSEDEANLSQEMDKLKVDEGSKNDAKVELTNVDNNTKQPASEEDTPAAENTAETPATSKEPQDTTAQSTAPET